MITHFNYCGTLSYHIVRMCEYSCVCVESPRNPSQPTDILGHDLDWLASKATASERGEENRGGERERVRLLGFGRVFMRRGGRDNKQTMTNRDTISTGREDEGFDSTCEVMTGSQLV